MTNAAAAIAIQLNGKRESIPSGMTLKALLESKEINPNTVACELNMTVIRRANLGTTYVNDGDIIEVIRMIGGG